MARYNQLKIAAFRLRNDHLWQRKLYRLCFPEDWKRPLIALGRSPQDRRDIKSIPIALLNQVIAALVPDVITVAKKATIGDNSPWLYSDTPLDTEALFAIVAAWIRTEAGTNVAKAEKILNTLKHSDLQWEPHVIDFTTLSSSTSKRETTLDDLYHLLPHVLAAELSSPEKSLEHLRPNNPKKLDQDEKPTVVATSTFRRCPAPQGACVMSWPPHHVPNKPFSFLIRLTTQTRPFDPAPLVHLTTGTRRWAHKEVTLSLNRDHSVYMLPKLPWLSGLVHSRSFLVAKIELRRKSSTKVKEGFEYSARWAGVHFEQILRELGIYEMLPSPEELKKNPVAGLSEVDAAALVFRNGMYTTFDHPVAAGTSLADKVPMLEWASETLAPYLEPVEPLRKGTHFILDHNKLKKDKYSTATPQQLRAAIADVIGPTLGVDILYDTRETKDQARAALATLLGIAVPEDTNRTTGKPEVITTEELTILSSVRPVGRCGGRLTVDGNIANPRERLKTAVSSRAKAIEDELGEAQAPTISLVEIKGKKSYQGKERAADPKFAIKVGLSRTGRLAQCITSGKDVAKDSDDSRSRSETLKNCWYDLLRQLGVRIQDLPVPLNGTSITTAPAYLAFWLIRQNQRNWEGITRQIPVAVLIDPTGREIKACAPNVKWMPLHRAQHEINRRHMLTDQRRTPEEVTRFFDGVLRSVARQFPSLLLLTCAQNLRWGWSALSNSTMKPDMIQFGHRPQPITRYPGLRHVRVRTPERDEVPDTYADNDKNAGHSPGYWVADNRIFLSTGEKPPAARKAVKDASKLVPRWVKGELVNARTKTPVWNSRALEITVAAIQPGDAPEDWAALTHELRWAAPHYAYSVSLPWPLKIAQQISQYVMPVELLEELEESEEEQEETDDLVG